MSDAARAEQSWWVRLGPFRYLLPALLIIVPFRLVPILYAFGVSFTDWNMGGFQRWVMLDNYRNLLADPLFWQSLLNTLWYVLGTVPTTLFLSLGAAMLLNRKLRARGFYRTLYYLPVVTSMVAISMVWKWIFHPRVGLANYLLGMIGVDPLSWLEEPRGILTVMLERIGFDAPAWMGGPSLALCAIMITGIWKGLGYNIVIFLTGLQNIPESYYEAARIDGAGPWHQFRSVTWGLLSPTTFYVLLMSTIVSFQVFGQIYMMTTPPGGPLGATNVIVFFLYQKGFTGLFRSGDASAVAFILFVIILALTLIQRRYGEARVHYQ